MFLFLIYTPLACVWKCLFAIKYHPIVTFTPNSQITLSAKSYDDNDDPLHFVALLRLQERFKKLNSVPEVLWTITLGKLRPSQVGRGKRHRF